jgi:hypothetical protein
VRVKSTFVMMLAPSFTAPPVPSLCMSMPKGSIDQLHVGIYSHCPSLFLHTFLLL